MMKKIKLILILLLILTVTSCSNKDVTKYYYDYIGESELWEVYYHEKSVVTFWEQDGRLENDSSTEATLTAVYKNDVSELAEVNLLEISYDTGINGSTWSSKYHDAGPDRRAFTIDSNNGLLAVEVDAIQVTIRIDDRTETFKLTKK